MLDHVGLPVADMDRSRAFYTKVLAVLGYELVMDVSEEMGGGTAHAGFGLPGKPQFWISSGEPLVGRLHLAFAAKDQDAVDRFYYAAIAAGASDNGPPGLRPHYHPNYYGAFVFDPDGHNIEAVCHEPNR
jgi:catechol 2,3-dioxygenase-like lactoylglutathione lyase family enzyme